MLTLSMMAKMVIGQEMSADRSHANAILYMTARLDTMSVCLACNGFLIPIYLPTEMKTMW